MPRPIEEYEVENNLIQSILKAIGGKIGEVLPKTHGFSLIIFSYEKLELFYISSVDRKSVVNLLKEFIEREERLNQS
jgi:hypothetical protein